MQSMETLKTRLVKAKTSLVLEHPFVGTNSFSFAVEDTVVRFEGLPGPLTI